MLLLMELDCSNTNIDHCGTAYSTHKAAAEQPI